jgi:Flp pilus assembly protein CpaB
MTEVLKRPGRPQGRAPSEHAPHPESLRARRVQRPRWRDARLLTGLLLVLGSVALGGRLIGSASHTTAWVAAARSLPVGHVLEAADLRRVQAHLPASTSGRYFASAPAALVGKMLSSPVQAGELLTATALAHAPAAESRIVPVVVHAGRLPVLAAGDRVDVYVLAKSSSGGGGSAAVNGREVRVLSSAEFVSEEALTSGDTSVQLRVPPSDAITVVAASQSGRVDLVRVDGASGHLADAGPSSVAGFGGS